MHTPVRQDRTDHPSRDPSDHANLDPRRQVKHPKSDVRARVAPRPGRPG